ncbi:hypothetical protein [Agromyces larvae]|uniref:Protein kinase domain-containing protein n=1 Tax=Agromyces larvae TaxID=2929802 RepID=A0ABY4C0M5_9MICO|nr:hypothetical protein [Agromyces larvae]UOE45027.1 hypothetical protein MTO99_04405 [Agromyces larvae]
MGEWHDRSDGEQVIAGYRVVRRVATGDRAALYLAAAVVGGDAGSGADDGVRDGASDDPARLVVLRVYPATADAERLALDVEAMTGDPRSAIPRLTDVATLADGQVCLIVERLAGPSLAAVLQERTLSAGEAVTVLAPIAAELGRLERRGLAPTRLSPADLVFDGAGRPRLIGTGAMVRLAGEGVDAATRVARVRESHAAFGGLIAEVARASRPSAPIERVRQLVEAQLAARPFVADSESYERALFEAATPSPVAGRWDGHVVRRSVAPPPSAALLRPVLSAAGASPIAAREPDTSDAVASDRRRVRAARSGLVRITADLLAIPRTDGPRAEPAGADRSARLGERIRRGIRRRRAPLTVAALIGGATLVLALTVVSPSGGSSGAGSDTGAPATAGAPGGSAGADEAAAGPETTGERAGGAAADSSLVVQGDDPAAAVAELLRVRAGCLADLDTACVEAVAQPGSALAAADRDAVLSARDGGTIAIDVFDLDHVAVIGSMGAAWLVQVPRSDEREPASVLAMSTEAGWRLREIFD